MITNPTHRMSSSASQLYLCFGREGLEQIIEAPGGMQG